MRVESLRKSPFSLTWGHVCLCLIEQHCEALCGSTYAILRSVFAALTGDTDRLPFSLTQNSE